MTRFARAKGSKASNERLPEQATPWSIMKHQLLDKNKELEENKNRQAALDQRNANYKAFLDEKEQEESKHTTWAEFPNSVKLKKKDDKPWKKKKNTCLDPQKPLMALEAKEKPMINNNSENNSNRMVESDSDAPPDEESSKVQPMKPLIKVKKKKNNKLRIVIKQEEHQMSNHENVLKKNKQENVLNKSEMNSSNKKNKHKKKSIEDTEISQHTIKRNIDNYDESKKKKLKTDTQTKQDSKNMKVSSNEAQQRKKTLKEDLTEQELKKIEKKKQRRIKQVLKKKRVKQELKKQKEEEQNNENYNIPQTEKGIEIKSLDSNINENNNTISKTTLKHIDGQEKKKPKNREKDHLRKKPLLPHKMFINGKELEIDYVDGFPVKKEDANRLKKLRKEMISKGVPRSQIDAALKLERRKAEKAFTREKKKVCFNCRKSGHNLSECPELGNNQLAETAGSGICFKCGSTEHTHFQCRVVKGQEFRFAQCFICNEQGHIARQCPDNARGLYPKGGSCKVCGDVTHLKKDCPKYQAQQQKQENDMRIETLGSSNPDVFEDENNSYPVEIKRPNKVIKFV